MTHHQLTSYSYLVLLKESKPKLRRVISSNGKQLTNNVSVFLWQQTECTFTRRHVINCGFYRDVKATSNIFQSRLNLNSNLNFTEYLIKQKKYEAHNQSFICYCCSFMRHSKIKFYFTPAKWIWKTRMSVELFTLWQGKMKTIYK